MPINSILLNMKEESAISWKNLLSKEVVEKIDPITKEMNKLMRDKAYLDLIMKNGREKAIYVADSVLNRVYTAVGFSKT